MLYRILFGIDALVALVVVFFFLSGVSDGTVSAFNILLWLGMLGAIAVLFGGGVALKAQGHCVLANIVSPILARPGLFYGFFILMLVILHPRWNRGRGDCAPSDRGRVRACPLQWAFNRSSRNAT